MICGRCSAKIDGDTVIFSHGKNGSLERLYARVCRHTIGKPSHNGFYCVNPCKTYKPSEDYGEAILEMDHEAVAKELLNELQLKQKSEKKQC